MPSPRLATHDDIPNIRALIERSVRALSVGFYTDEEAEAGIAHVFGVDTQLIHDRTYYVIDAPDGLAAAGGWSKRRTLYGGDQMKEVEDPLLDPAVDAARLGVACASDSVTRPGAQASYPDRERAAELLAQAISQPSGPGMKASSSG